MTTTEPDVLDFPGAETLEAAGRVDPPSPSAVAAARAAVREAVARDTAAVPRQRRGRVRRRSAVAALAVAAVTAAVLVYPTLSVDGGSPAASANAAAFLQHVADTAAGESKPATDAPYWKVRARYTHPRAKPDIQTSWFSRTAVILEQGPGRRDSGACRDGFCYFPEPRGMVWTIGKTKLTWDELGKLPTDPAALKARLLGDSAGNTATTGNLYNSIVQLLATAPSSPQLRAALFEILAGMDGVRLVGPAKDSAGRQGTAVEWQGPELYHRLIVDPDTSDVLEHQQKGSATGGAWLGTTYLSVGPAWKLG
ncbi:MULTISPECIES: CU044_5270 family protein [unclassified Streptomyces]|uniref:CU044_5270 family protein n=1 Tax=unclassified Streptomyces TaxID=2593676 RepID=UPI002DD95078|nr:CU044_5270 family protein [Streptomyces sp. NBC_00243]WRZ24129.1 CU044_5270 family protein [Streptomyces sp. NBC_00243]